MFRMWPFLPSCRLPGGGCTNMSVEQTEMKTCACHEHPGSHSWAGSRFFTPEYKRGAEHFNMLGNVNDLYLRSEFSIFSTSANQHSPIKCNTMIYFETHKKAHPISTWRGLVLLWVQHSFHKWSHFCEPKFQNCVSLNRDRCSPDVSWTFEYRSSFLASHHCSSCAPRCPDQSQHWLWHPKGLQWTPTQLWLSPEKALFHYHWTSLQASLVVPVSHFFPRDLALFSFAPIPRSVLVAEFSWKYKV